MAGGGSSSTEFGDDYIEIVNEINDFIASLTASSTEKTTSHHSTSSGSPVEYPPVYPSVYPGDGPKQAETAHRCYDHLDETPQCQVKENSQSDVPICPDIATYDFVNHVNSERRCVDRRTYLLDQPEIPNYRREYPSDHSEYPSDRSDYPSSSFPSDRSDCPNSVVSDRSDCLNSVLSDRSDCQNSFTSDRSDCPNSILSDYHSDKSDFRNEKRSKDLPTNDDSSEDDYEPIESLPPIRTVTPLVPPPLPPLRPKFRKMSEGPPKYVKALHTFKGSNNDEVRYMFILYTLYGWMERANEWRMEGRVDGRREGWMESSAHIQGIKQ